MNQIENGVACLQALDSMHELSASAVINIEEKLDLRMQKEISKLITTNTDPTKKRKDIVLTYLLEEKKATQLRVSNYSKGSFKQQEETSSHYSSTRGRGRGRGRGNSNRGRNDGSQPSRGNQRSSNKSSSCLLCGDNHFLPKCPKWMDLSTDKRFLLGFCKTNWICTHCLNTGHNWKNCSSQDAATCPCSSTYNMMVCCESEDCRLRKNWNQTSNNSAASLSTVKSNSTTVNGVRVGSSILPIQVISSPSSSNGIRTMFDNCSQNTFVCERSASKFGFMGCRVAYVLVTTDGSKKQMTGTLYDLDITDRYGNIHQIQAIGIANLSTVYAGFKVFNVKKKVKDEKNCKDLTDEKLHRSSGSIDLLIGSDLASLHPHKVAAIRDLVILKCKFGTGWTVQGHSRHHVKFIDNYKGSCSNFLAVEQVELIPEVFSSVAGTKDQQFLECLATESVGVNLIPKCQSCKVRSNSCRECLVISKTSLYLEYLQDQQIEENIEKIPNSPGYIASYPYNKEVELLLPNEEISRKRAESMEQTLLKKPADMEKFNQVIIEGFENGTYKWLMEKDIRNWKGLVHYIPINVVYKESESTPIRPTFDSSQPDRNGRSLNTCMGKGRNPINHFGAVILNFRSAENVACGDIRRMLNQIQVREKDMHLGRFFKKPDGYGGK